MFKKAGLEYVVVLMSEIAFFDQLSNMLTFS